MLGYDSSSACDSFQLGEMVKFFTGRNLLFLVNFSPASQDAIRDFAAVDVAGLMDTLRQTPAYQIDKHHKNCGLRSRIVPILDYIRTMLSSNTVPLNLPDWKKKRKDVTWQVGPLAEDGGRHPKKKDFDAGGADERKIFRFTRSVATDQRLRYEGAMAADSMAKQLFLAEDWDWTPEEDSGPGGSLGREFATTKWLR